MICDECRGIIDQKSGFCTSCGLEAVNFDESEFSRSVFVGSRDSGMEESRDRASRKVALKAGRGNRGFICNRCREMFDESVHTDITSDLYSSVSRFEEAGTNLYTFRLKQDLDEHIRLIHQGKPWADTTIRKLGTFNKENNAKPNQRGKEE